MINLFTRYNYLYRKGGTMSNRYVGNGSYDGKYGEKTVEWENKQSDESFTQYNVKDVKTGDHYFTNTRTGVQGAALENYRPGRD